MWNKYLVKKFSRISGAGTAGGFTLIEVITAMFIIMVGIFSGYSLVNQSIISANRISMQLTAAYLGREGLEIVRNIRDSNYLKSDGTTWASGLAQGATDCSGGCAASYNSIALAPENAGQPLKYSPTAKLFSYDNPYGDSVNTPYKRKITIVPGGPGEYLDVEVAVTWLERGKSHEIILREYFYNWWPQD